MTSFLSFLGTLATGGVLLWLFQQAKQAWSARRKLQAEQQRLLRILCGLPDEMKEVLVLYHLQGTHTRRLDPLDDVVAQLIRLGLCAPGEGAGAFAAVSRWIVLREPIWNLLGPWLAMDARARLILQELQQAPEEPDQ